MSDRDLRADEALVRAINAGDVSAFDTLYYRYRDYVVRLARRFTGNDEDALDVLQDTFAYLLGKFPGFRLTSRMTTFLYPAIKHLSITLAQKRRRLPADERALRTVAAPSEAPGSSIRSELSTVLAALPEGQLEVVLMRFVDDMTLAEIADALEVPLGTVKSRLHKALQTLRHDPRTRRHFLE